MPLQNRVDPTGTLHATPSRGTFMGNKGCLHNDKKQIVKSVGCNGWVICALQFKSRKREIMATGTYTELFFLDEATALAAGHRPCGECLRAKFVDYKHHWISANCDTPSHNIKMADINKINQKERYYRGSKITFNAPLNSLPNGAFIELNQNYYLIYQGAKYLWSFTGYSEKSHLSNETVTVLTPKSVIKALADGYEPEYHPSLNTLLAT
jgi:hypothetical protein